MKEAISKIIVYLVMAPTYLMVFLASLCMVINSPLLVLTYFVLGVKKPAGTVHLIIKANLKRIWESK